ncbi:non-ribosomal peptide synthetase, partial [Chamaesiphon polymorphus]
LTLSMSETPEGLVGDWEYNTDLFDAATIERMAGHFENLLSAIGSNPHQLVSEISLLSAAERQQLLVEWNQTASQYPDDKCIHHLFEAQVEKTPDAIAVVFEDEQLTYQQLNQRANQLAHHLQSLGVKPEVLVGICVERSLAMVVGLLGILKAGGAYVPLDPSYPPERLSYMLADAGVEVLLTQQDLLASLPAHSARLVCLDTDWDSIARASATNLSSDVAAANLAYVIYTSGSTGLPKGVQIEHQAIVWHCHNIQSVYRLESSDRVLQFASIGFDPSVEQIFVPLAVGASIVVRGQLWQPFQFHEYVEKYQISVVDLPPAYWQQLILEWVNNPQSLRDCSIRLTIVGGDVMPSETVKLWQQTALASSRLLNAFGLTEATITSTIFDVSCLGSSEQQLESISIGKPIANTQIYILDRYLQPVPIGVPGELHIGGDSLARGYLNRPDFTAAKFISDPFSDDESARLYKTGDLARYLSDGNIEFLGRIDNQVKIRGFRIELGEVEAVLSSHPQVQQAVVIDMEDRVGKRLVAYLVTGDESLSAGQVREYVKHRLPEYMVPAAIVTLDSIPLTPNGKVDRKALPIPDGEILRTHEYVAPRTPNEEIIANIWQELLLKEKISVNDNFFEIGGDSILSIQVVSRARSAGLQITPKQVFQNQTIATLAAVANTTTSVTARQGVVTGSAPLTPIQSWFFSENTQELDHFNQSVLLQIPNHFQSEPIEKSFKKLLEHHDALRLRFRLNGSDYEQISEDFDNNTSFFSVVDLSSVPKGSQPQALSKIATEFQASLNLSTGSLIQVIMFNLGDRDDARLLIIIHHLVVDGVSWRILLSDLATIHQQLVTQKPIQLSPKTTAFIDWATKLKKHAYLDNFSQELEYLLRQDWSMATPLPLDNNSTNFKNTVGCTATVTLELSEEETHILLGSVNEAYNTQINDILLSALVLSLGQWTENSTVLINLEGHGREEIFEDVDLSRTVGWFTSMFPVLLYLPSLDRLSSVIKSIKEQLRAIPNRGIGYGILRYLCEDPNLREQLQVIPNPEISFNYLGQFVNAVSAQQNRVQSNDVWKFATESTGLNENPNRFRSHLLDINCLVIESKLRISWTYNPNIHSKSTVEKLAKSYISYAQSLIEHCQSKDVFGYTPSDFPLTNLAQDKLDALLEKLAENI